MNEIYAWKQLSNIIYFIAYKIRMRNIKRQVSGSGPDQTSDPRRPNTGHFLL